jgi:hypothetical protein
MADITINQLTSAPSIVSSLLLPVTDGASTYKLSIANINSLAPVQSVAARTGAIVLTKTDVGLANVTNDAQLKIASNLSDLNNAATARTNIGLGSVENKSSATIRGELTSTNVTTALNFTPYNNTNPSGFISNTNAAVAKAWVSFNGHGTIGQNQSIYRSYNVTRVFRDSNYNYTIYFTNPMPNTNYAFTGTSVSMGVVPTVREDATSQPINSCLTDRLLISTGSGGSGFIGSYVSIIVFN